MKRVVRIWAAAVAATTLIALPVAAAADTDETIPLTQLQYERVRTFVWPLTTVSIYQADPDDSGRDELLETFDAQDGPDGTILTMPDRVLFDFASAELRSSAQDRLERLLLLLEGTDGSIRIIGHTDDVGTDAVNQSLSEDRAQAVADHLAANGFDTDRIATEGRSDREPVEPNRHDDGSDNPAGRQANRRVEVIVELD